uniref:Uncharacterized protein n=1 Tax=Ditylenchus dipsaci TaxID=166011 RepID=A0A915CQ54_9BILA
MTSGGDDGNSWDKDTLPKKHCMDGSCTGIALEEHEPVSPSSTTKGVNELQHNSGYHTLSPNNKDLCLFYHQGSKKCSVHPDSYTKNSKATVAAAPNISKRHSRQPKESDPPKQQGSYLSNLLTYTYQPPRESKTTFIATATLKHHLQSMTSNVVSGVPLATDQSHKHALSQQHQQQFSNANGHPGQEREFFDPMVADSVPTHPHHTTLSSTPRSDGVANWS